MLASLHKKEGLKSKSNTQWSAFCWNEVLSYMFTLTFYEVKCVFILEELLRYITTSLRLLLILERLPLLELAAGQHDAHRWCRY